MPDRVDHILESVREDRRPFVRRLVTKTTYAPPAVSSFSMSGIQATYASPPATHRAGTSEGSLSTPLDGPTPRRRWRRRQAGGDRSGRTVSRRRLFGLVGGAAAAGAGLAVAGAGLQPGVAGADTGDPILIGKTNSTGTTVTTLSPNGAIPSPPQTFSLVNTLANANATTGTGVALTATTGTGIAVVAMSNSSPAVSAQSSAPQVWLRNSNSGSQSGHPSSGLEGEVYTNSVGELWFCTQSGTPGTWVPLSSPFIPITPTRVYDSRPGFPPDDSNPKTPIQSGSTVNVDVTNGSSIPQSASAVVGNLTVANTHGPVGSFLTVFAQGTAQPPTSNLNWGTGQIVANNFTSQVNSANGLISVFCSGGQTDFIVDLFGYYP
jgi:hypothetical protein